MMKRIIATLSKTKLKPFFVIPGLETETGEAVVRLLGIGAFGLFLFFTELTPTSKPEFFAAFNLFVVQLIYASFSLVCSWQSWFSNSSRRVCTTVLDQALFAAGLYAAGEIMSPFLFVPICVTLGTGLRYGRSYAVFSATGGSLFIAVALMVSPFWQRYPQLSIGLGVAVCVIPLYVFRLTDQLAVMLRTDVLTGASNRRGFEENLENLLNAVAHNNTTGALVLLDLDGFKKINDDKSHLVGDKILQEVAACLRAELGAFGMPARFGGDEFAVVVSELTSKRNFELMLDQVLARVVEIGSYRQCDLSASVGVFYLKPGQTQSAKFAFGAADDLLYLSKESGKNQYQTSDGRFFTSKGKLTTDPGEIAYVGLAA